MNAPFSPFPPTPDYDDVESPSLTSGNALARFEFERLDNRDSRNVGTKVLMVEWEEDATTAPVSGEWTVSWDSKSAAAVVATDSQSISQGEKQEGQLHRLYFLLPQWAKVPGTVVLTLTGTNKETGNEDVKIVWRTNPLPAIYPTALGNSARASGKRGVLHTVWAKKRLQSLATEIENEKLQRPESIGLDLAIQERDWIEQNFGVKTRPRDIKAEISEPASLAPPPTLATGNTGSPSPSSPKSPGRGPLLDKLKGLKLSTGNNILNPPSRTPIASPDASEHNPLSPETSDVAVSWGSFADIQGITPSTSRDILAAKPPQRSQQPFGGLPDSPPALSHLHANMRTIAPPESVLQQQRTDGETENANLGLGMINSNAFAALAQSTSSSVVFRQPVGGTSSYEALQTGNDEDDLFALPLSPRSPAGAGTGQKAFSFAVADTSRYIAGS